MNLLFFAHESRMGGANLSMLGMIDEMAEKHNIFVVLPIKKGFMAEELKKRQIPVYYRHYFWWMLAPEKNSFKTFIKKMIYKVLCFNNFFCALSLCKVVKERQIDIIHTNSSVINTGGLLSLITGIPHVWHLREFGQEDFGFFSVWKYDRICDFINRHSDRVVAISQAIARKFQGRISPEKLTVVYNGVSEKNIRNKSQFIKNNNRIDYLISGRISPEKGQDDAIQAVGILVGKGYRNIHLSIAGPGDAGYLKTLIKKENLSDYVSILGMVEDMPALRQEMDIELVCSVCEGFGRVTVEAMMSSNPVIGSDTGATTELIRNNENGFLYKNRDIENLAQKMEIFLKRPEQIRIMGNNAYKWSTKSFRQSQNAKEIERIYCEIATGRAGQ